MGAIDPKMKTAVVLFALCALVCSTRAAPQWVKANETVGCEPVGGACRSNNDCCSHSCIGAGQDPGKCDNAQFFACAKTTGECHLCVGKNNCTQSLNDCYTTCKKTESTYKCKDNKCFKSGHDLGVPLATCEAGCGVPKHS